jgi:hypothetical protein
MAKDPELLRRSNKNPEPADFVARKGAFYECRRLCCAPIAEKKGVTLP